MSKAAQSGEKTGEPWRNSRMDVRPEVQSCTAGCGGAMLGAFVGSVLAIGIVVTCHSVVRVPLVSPAADDVIAFWVALLLIISGIVVGAIVGVRIGGKNEVGISPLPPDVEAAARTHFIPSTRATDALDNLEDRIKQPDASAGPTTDPTS